MVADEYFDLRSRLGAALFSLGRIADLAGLKPSRTPVVKSLVEGLRDPFVFVVAGEVNAGKSTLLNALFGEDFCPSSVLPETRRIHYFRYGRTPRRAETGPRLEEIELPYSFLRDFNVVDTPGVNSIEEGHELITGEFIPRADAVLYCFPATNPWSSASWEFLAKIHHDWLKKIVLVLQQADLRTPEETAAIAEHMRSLGRQRLGVDFPVFPVSARLALLARTSGLDKSRLLAESSFPAFEQQLTRMVAGAAPRLGKLVSACSTGQAMLAEVQSKLAAGAAALFELTQLQAQVKDTAAETAAAARQQANEAVGELRTAWDAVSSANLSAALTERCGFPELLRAGDATADTIESRFLQPLLAAVRNTATGCETKLDAAMSALWKQPGSAIHRALEGRVRRPLEPDWPSRDANFLPSLENVACEAVAGSGLAVFWQGRLQRRRGMICGLTMLGSLFTAGLAAGLAAGSLPAAAAGWLGALTVGCSVAAWSALRRETEETFALTTNLLAAAGDQFSAATRPLLHAYGERRIGDFTAVTQPLANTIQQKEQAAAPLTEEVSQLALTLQTLSRSFHHGTAG